MNNARSRSPRHKREYSFSSLSSGSIENDHRPFSNKSGRDRNSEENQRRDRKSRKHSKERRGDTKGSRFESRNLDKNKEKWSESERSSKANHYESPEEESYLNSVYGSHRGHNIRAPIVEKGVHQIGHEVEESMQDPSTCNFRGVLPLHHDEITGYGEPVQIDERMNQKDETSGRLERLEKLVELLAKNDRTHQPGETNISRENDWPSSTSPFELIPRNTNFTTSMWLNKIQDECIERNFDEKTSIQFMQSKMTGVVKAWFKSVSSYDFTWPELKMLITDTFPDNIEFASTLKLLVNRTKKPDETVTQYYFSKMYLLEACKISGVNAVSCLIDGLENETWKQEAKNFNFLTPEALYSHYLSKYIDQYQYKQSQEVVEVYQVNPVEKQGENHFVNNNDKPFVKKRCFTCNKCNHLTADCRHAPICYRCHKKGHIAVHCPLKVVHH